MTSPSALSSLSRLLLGAPLLAALSLPVGCSHSAPPAEPPPAPPAVTQSTRPVTAAVTEPTPAVSLPPPDTGMSSQGTMASPSYVNRPGARRDATLATPPIVAGRVDRGDLSEALIEPSPAIIEQREIDQMFEDNSDTLQKCYRDQRAPSGSEIVVGFVIGADGRVASAWPVATQVNDVRVTQCVIKTVSGFRFHETPGGTTRATSTIRYE